jgi:hypothetical protein
LGLVEDKRGGAPTAKWTQLRADFGGTLSQCLKEAYSDLFSFYPDAHLRDDEALTSFFRGSTEGSAEEVERMVNAFNAVRQLATFSEAEENEGTDNSEPEAPKIKNNTDARSGSGPDANSPRGKESGAAININIQLQLPADASGEIYDKLFEAMKKHLPL